MGMQQYLMLYIGEDIGNSPSALYVFTSSGIAELWLWLRVELRRLCFVGIYIANAPGVRDSLHPLTGSEFGVIPIAKYFPIAVQF